MDENTKTKLLNFLKSFVETSSIVLAYNNNWHFIKFNLQDIDKYYDNFNCYFCPWVSKDNKSWKDTDIVEKKSFSIDIDIREIIKKKSWIIIDQTRLKHYIDEIKNLLNWHEMYRQRRYIICTWNWMQIHYVGKSIETNIEMYSWWVKFIYEEVDKLLEPLWMECDTKVSNIATLLRLPYTKNVSMKSKFLLEPEYAEILYEQDVISEAVWTIIFAWDLYLSERKAQDEYVKKILDEKHKSQSTWYEWDSIYEAILQHVNVWEMFSKHKWIAMKKDWINFKSPKDSSNIAVFYREKDNLLFVVSSATQHITHFREVFNPRTYAKFEMEIWDDKKIFEYFKENYWFIQKIDDDNKKKYLDKLKEEKKKQQESVINIAIENIDEHFVTYWELLGTASRNRQKINPNNLIKYWIKWLDDNLVWILPDELVVIGAQTWVGKSEVAYSIAITNAIAGKKVLLFSLEWNIEEVALRYLQKEIYKHKQLKTYEYRFNTRDFSMDEDAAIYRTSENLKNNLIVFNKKTIPSMQFITEVIRKKNRDVDLIIIDHLHYIPITWDNENRGIWEIMRELKILTDIEKKPVVLVSHLRKPTWKKEIDDEPTEFDLYWSSNVAKEATTIILLSKYNKDLHPMNWLPSTSWQDSRYATRIVSPKSRIWLGKLKMVAIYDKHSKTYINEGRDFLDDNEFEIKDFRI